MVRTSSVQRNVTNTLSTKKRELTLDEHLAGPSMAGYLYQLSYALLQMFDLDEDASIGIEIIDDVSVHRGTDVSKSIQLKYNVIKQEQDEETKLTDGSRGLWKTLGIWAQAIQSERINLEKLHSLILISVAPLPKRSIAQLIALNNESPSKERYNQIIERLRNVKTSSQKDLIPYFNAVHRLDEKQLLYPFVQKLIVKGGQPRLVDSSKILRKRIKNCGFYPHVVDDVAKHFEGWLFEEVAKGLESLNGVQISWLEFQAEHRHLHATMQGNTLIARYDTWDRLEEIERSLQEKEKYIKQLVIVGASDEDKHDAIMDYFRAFSERTQWLSRSEISREQLNRFDRKLVEAWKSRFRKMRSMLINSEESKAFCQAGLQHFYDMQIQSEQLGIQPDWQYGAYLSKGSYHMLANELHVGWHPEFQALLNNLSHP